MKLKDVKKLLVKAVLHSSDGVGVHDVKLKAEQMIKLNFTAKAKLRKTVNLHK
jgi:hypothetical protein